MRTKLLACTFATTGLFAAAAVAQQPLTPPPVPVENPLTPAKVVLGKILFWDEQLSSDDSVACGTCHRPEAGGADPRALTSLHPGADGVFGTVDDVHGAPGVVRQDVAGDYAWEALFGVDLQVTGRTSPTMIGAAYHGELFWDGRATSQFVDPETQQVAIAYGGALESQAVGPILSPAEMATEGRTWNDVRQKLQAVTPLALGSNLPVDVQQALAAAPTYPDLFRAAFGDPAITARRIAFALASYQRVLVPDQTPYDAFIAGNSAALTQNQTLGLLLFEGSARCVACHPGPFFSDDMHHNLGLRPAVEDPGRQAVTLGASDAGAFKTPTLRNAGLRPRLFHNGASPALGSPNELADPNSVINVYFFGGGVDRTNLDPFLLNLSNLGIRRSDLQMVMDFVQHGLTDPRAANRLPPFDHPDLRSATEPPPSRHGASLAGAIEPRIVDSAPSFLGNGAWKVGFAAGSGNGLGYVALSTQALPAPVWVGALPINIGPAIDGFVLAMTGTPGQPGVGTWRIGIPANPLLQGLPIETQLFALDAASPVGIAASQATGFLVK